MLIMLSLACQRILRPSQVVEATAKNITYFKICFHTRGTKIRKKTNVSQHYTIILQKGKKNILNRNSAAFASHLSTVGRATYESHFVANDRGRSVLSNTYTHVFLCATYQSVRACAAYPACL